MQNCWIIKILETKHGSIQFGILTTLFIIHCLLVLPQNVTAQTGDPSPSSKDQVIMQNPLELSPGMALLCVGLIATFFILGCLSIYVRRCMDAWLGISRGGMLPIRNRVSHGMDPKVIANFATFLYSHVKDLKIGKGALECAVCLNEFDDDATLRLLPKCCHVFHTECIDTWLASHVTCPVCRSNLIHVHEQEVINNPNLPMWDSVFGSRSPQNSSELPIDIRTVTNPVQDQDPVQSCLEISKTPNSTGRDMERFTLRLAEGAGIRRVVSDAVFPSERSPKRWFRRSSSSGTGRGINNNNVTNERFDRVSRSDRWGLSKSVQPFTRLTGNNPV